ncbi:MAG: GRP family sugar transporter [Bacteroidota bacterium]|nr:GRP family sugar transporter [Bacteroidota bacterium]
MILIQNYGIAILCCFITMICWGSWANTQKLAAKSWRYELFYFDFVIGLLLTAIVAAFTVGSIGETGRHFIQDLGQADGTSIMYALVGGIVWNLGTFLLVAAMAVAGMAVGFPVGGGLAWVLGIVVNYLLVVLDKGTFNGNPVMLFVGVAAIVAAIIFCTSAYRRQEKAKGALKSTKTGLLLALCAGITIAFFYGLVVKSLDHQFVAGGSGTLTPFTGVFLFAIGAVISTPIFNLYAMKHPVQGIPVVFSDYFKGSLGTHLTGVLGGIIWMIGMELSFMAAGAANPAISYALSNAAPVVAMIWGVLIWKEFRDAPKGTNARLAIMFGLFILGLVLITLSSN